MKIPANIKKYFWEIDPIGLHLKEDASYIISRILEYGDPAAVRWIFRYYSKKNIETEARRSRNMSRRSKALWSRIAY